MFLLVPSADADTLGLIAICLSLALLFSLEVLEARRQKRQAERQLAEASEIITAQNIILASLVIQQGGHLTCPVARLQEDVTVLVALELVDGKPFATVELGPAEG